jgi:LacI family transcriptional regulator
VRTVVNIRDVAKRAGVSAGTVSNVLNRPSYVGVDLRKRVLDVMAELEFAPSRAARQSHATRERTIGLSLADMSSPFFVDVALAADEEAKRHGMGVVLVLAGDDLSREAHNLDLLVRQRVQGILVTPVDELNPRLEELSDRGIPIVYVDRISGNRPCCWVTSDDVAGARLAADHLLERGHRRMAFAGGSTATGHVARRFEGFERAVTEGGGTVRRIDTAGWRLEDGHAAAAEIAGLPEAERPTAVMGANDLVALGMLQELWERGIRVPEDVALVGFDDLVWAGAAMVPITSVHQQRQQLAARAVQLLIDEVENPQGHEHAHVVLEPQLIVRASSALTITTVRPCQQKVQQ